MQEKVITFDWPFTEEQMMEHFQVDNERWEATKRVPNTWTTSMKNKDWEPIQVLNQQSKLFLQKKYPEFFESIEDYIKKFINTTPQVREYNTQDARWAIDKLHRDHSHILTTTIYADTHLDKMTKQSMKSKINNIIEADKRIFDKMDRFASQKQLFVVLWDFFNSDWNYKTTKGTEQQNSTTEYDAWKKWTELLAEVLYNRSWYTDIDVILAQWNHDSHKLMYLRDLLHYYFKNNDKISIANVEENWRYTYKRWNNLLWFTHGDWVAQKDLPLLMWDKSAKYKEWYTWHTHKNITESYHWMNVNTIGAMTWLWTWNDKYWVDHINKQLFWVLHHKKDGKVAQFYQPIK